MLSNALSQCPEILFEISRHQIRLLVLSKYPHYHTFLPLFHGQIGGIIAQSCHLSLQRKTSPSHHQYLLREVLILQVLIPALMRQEPPMVQYLRLPFVA